ncbi:MAG: GNAT family N-acetyltransferase [Beijerinckiaceae bacterium]
MATGLAHSLRVSALPSVTARSDSPVASRVSPAALVAEAIRPDQYAALAVEAKSLAGRTLEPNAFYEPSFLAHALHHFKGRLTLVLIWDGPARQTLLGLFPLAMPRFDVAAPVLRGWLTPYMTNGAPLIDAEAAEAVFDRFMQWVREEAGQTAAVVFPSLVIDGPVASLIRAQAVRLACPVRTFEARTRAVLRGGRSAPEFLAQNISSKKAKELRRQRNRLAEMGVLSIRTVHDRAGVRAAFEHFMAIEARSWKGSKGTAMMQIPSVAAFARSMVRSMAGEGLVRIDMLELDGTPIAASIQLRSGDRSYFWKTAYDDAYARFSPGVQLAIELSVINLQDQRISLSDSCAISGHPMIDELWDERISVGDLMVAANADRPAAARLAATREGMRRSLRARLKSAVNAIR